MKKVNKLCKIRESDYDFAIDLFNIDLPSRSAWLVQKVANSGLSEKDLDVLFDELSKGGLIGD